MTLAQLRTMVRRRLQEDVADQWSDSELNDLINVALQRMQTAIMRVHPEAFISIATANVVVGSTLQARFYSLPPGFWYETMLELLGTDGEYAKLERKSYREARAADEGSDAFYARHGQYFVLAPAPAAAVTNGLRVTFVPTLSLSADTDVPAIPVGLHAGIVLWAHLFALPESGEAEAQESVRRDLKALTDEIPLVYLESASDPAYLVPDIQKGY